MTDRFYNGRVLVLAAGILYLLSVAYFQRWEVNIIKGGDSWGYYGYLPATFIYGDLDNIDTSYLARFEYAGEPPYFPAPGGELPIAENGHRVIKYTCGVAILQLPFFAVGHAWATLDQRYQTDGYSLPYIFSVLIANLFYLLFGTFLLFKVLSKSTDRRTAFWTLLAILFATNLYNFAVYRGTMAHSYLFGLYGILIYASYEIYQKPKYKWAIGIGLAAGMITLIRPVEILCLAIPFFYGLTSKEKTFFENSRGFFEKGERSDQRERSLTSFKEFFTTKFAEESKNITERLQYWQVNWQQMGLSAILFMICGIPQLFYWKYASGQWRFDSYPNEGFDFSHARIYEGLFSYQNGMFVYAPIMILAAIGFFWLWKKREWLWPLVAIIPLHIWIAYSWWNWYYINGFGSRPMVEVYALLAFPMAYCVQWLLNHPIRKTFFFAILITATSLQLFQNWQHSKGILWSEMANKAYYWSVFGQTKMTYDALVAFDTKEMQPDSLTLDIDRVLVEENFEAVDTLLKQVDDPVFNGELSVVLSPQRKYLEVFNAVIKTTDLKPNQWIRASSWCQKQDKEFPWYVAPSMVINVERNGENIKYKQIRIDSKLGNEGYSLWGGRPDVWGFVRLWFQLPNDLQPEDRIKVFFMAEKHPVFIDEVKIESWNER